jgi:uncharacterized protein YjbJ (UPF0337 family)
MNWNQVEGYWTQLRGKAREQWGQITNRPVDIINGQREQAVGLLQRRYGAAQSLHDATAPLLKRQSEVS